MEAEGNWRGAASFYGKILELGTLNSWDRFFYARAVLYAGDLAEAAKAIDNLSEDDLHVSGVAVLRAELAERAKHFEQSLACWQEAQRLGATQYWCLYGSARALARLGRFASALELMEQAADLPELENDGKQFIKDLRNTIDPVVESAGHAPGALPKFSGRQDAALAEIGFDELLAALLHRLQAGEKASRSVQTVMLAQELAETLQDAVEANENRFSITNLHNLFWGSYGVLETKTQLRDATVLEMGSGSHNPFSLVFLYLMLGAKRAFANDLEEMQHPARVFRAMARAADVLMTDAKRVIGDYPISRDEIERNLSTFDLGALRAGDARGIDPSRLQFLQGSAAKLAIDASSVDLILSVTFLEHVEDLDAVLEEMARVTVSGGRGVHCIDCIDHRWYGDPEVNKLHFLRVAKPGMVFGSNRVRLLEYPLLFQKHGFHVEQIVVLGQVNVDDELRQSLALPWREMSQEMLETTQGIIVVKRVT
jgi:tetratricopeptide (TPR) repeat protein